MYNILKSIIMSRKVSIDKLYHKADVAWANGDITDEQKIELEKMIFQYQNPQTESPDLAQLYNRLYEKYENLQTELADLKPRVVVLESGDTEPVEPQEPVVVIPEWEPWDGINNQYQYGAVVTHNGKYFIDVLQGMQNTWEPGGVGIDERYWKEITKEQAEGIINGDLTVDDILGAASEV